MNQPTRAGFLYGLAAYGWWGLVPIYFHWLGKISPLDILAHRIAWSAVFIAILLTYGRRWPEVLRCFRTPALLVPLCVSAALVAYNWMIYITAVYIRDIVQASLGYFILPLMSIALALVVFRERLRPLQKLAIAFAAVGVALLTWQAGVLPWLALSLALSFSVYGMIRKRVPVDGLLGLAVETFVLLPIALAYLGYDWPQRVAEAEDALLLFKLSLSGIVTAVPLLCFGQAARKLPFSMLGFMQYIAPSIQFLLALLLFHEKVDGWLNYGLVWTALVIFSCDSYLQYRKIEEQVALQPTQEPASTEIREGEAPA